jgi:importin-7
MVTFDSQLHPPCRYGNPSSLTKHNSENYNDFSKYFIENFAPEILKGYLAQIEKWVAQTAWLSKPCQSFTLAFLDECVKPKSTWDHLKPHLENLVKHVIFPILCFTDDDLELFENEPTEYLHRKLNFYEDASAPDLAATNFLATLTKSRKKQTFMILGFINEVVNRYETAPDNQKNPREKEGAMRMIGTLASVILAKKSPIANEVEFFFVRHIFPEFRSPHGYLRARACDTLEKFQDLDFKEETNLHTIYRNILESMADPELPVRVEAALALQPLIRHDFIRNSMQQNIPQIMQQLLKLANEVDVDSLANVMEEFVEVFAQELTPFAVALTEQLRDTYMRIVRELIEKNASAGDDDEVYGDFLDDKSITALGVLQTIGTLILTLESTPDVLLHLETILMPVITITLENKLFDLYNEVFEIIDSCTFSAKAISETMWQAFVLIHKSFKTGAELYLEDMLPALDNYISYGSQTLVQNPPYLEMVVDIIQSIFMDDRVGGVDRICGCKLAEALMLHLRGHIDVYVPKFIELGMTFLTNKEIKVKSYRVHLMEMVINAIYYNPRMAIQVLESGQWTNAFFSLWFSSMDNFTRVHDKKLCIGAIVALMSLRADEIPETVQQGWPRLLQGIVRLFQTLPLALKNREEATKDDFTVGDDAYDEVDDDDDNEWGGETQWATDGADEVEEDVKDESAAYLEFLNEEAKKFGTVTDLEDDELEEESLIESPLDGVEPYGLFKDALLSKCYFNLRDYAASHCTNKVIEMQAEQPQLYENVTKNLGPDEQGIIQTVVHQADAISAAAAAAQAAAASQQAVQANGTAIQ